MTHPTEQIVLAKSLGEVPATQWNALAGNHPAVRHEYLNAMEVTGCVGPGTGWIPQHLLLYRQGSLVAAMPLYIKSHSRGEFVFDYAWADAFERHGVPYYPKLLCAVPFTPVPGPRLLAHSREDKTRLLQTALAITDNNQISTLHILFPQADDLDVLAENSLMVRTNIQFHWSNQGYTTMDDFLKQMNQKNRKKIRQSRRKLENEGIHFQWLEGNDIRNSTLDFFYRCYQQTYFEHGHQPYLKPEFFYQLRDSLPDSLTVILARRKDGVAIASALNLRSNQHLYGRYWGSTEFVPGLHFETCYMQGIEYCIARQLETFEGGAQGEHKLARGLMPVQTYSAHWVRDRAYARAIEDFLKREQNAVTDYVDLLESHSPFRQKASDEP